MIPESGYQFEEKIMRHQKARRREIDTRKHDAKAPREIVSNFCATCVAAIYVVAILRRADRSA
jgi:hypothetical protein